MWLQMGEDDGAPLVYFHQVKHMLVGYADGQDGAVEENAQADEKQAKAQVPTAGKVVPKQAVLWMLMQQDAYVWTARAERWRCGGPRGRSWHWCCMLGRRCAAARSMAGEWTLCFVNCHFRILSFLPVNTSSPSNSRASCS